MSGIRIGCSRCSTENQDLTARRQALSSLGVPPDLIQVDHGLTGASRNRPGLTTAIAACRAGDVLVVTKLDRLARSLTDARNIVDELTAKGVILFLGGSEHDPDDPIGRLLFNALGMLAEFEADLIRLRTKEGTAITRANGKLKGQPPKLSPARQRHLIMLWEAGSHTQVELAELFEVSRTTIYREIKRCEAAQWDRPAMLVEESKVV